MAMSGGDIRDFNGFLANATDRQVANIIEKERTAGRDDYAALAEAEGYKRKLSIPFEEDDDEEDEEEKEYQILRFYQNSNIEKEVIETGLTLEEARDHCSDDESCSKTCTDTEACQRTQQKGAWFDGYEEE